MQINPHYFLPLIKITKSNVLWASIIAATLLGTFTFPAMLDRLSHINHSPYLNDNALEHEALAASLPLSVDANYQLTERAGDARLAPSTLQIDENFIDPENHCEMCTRLDYKPSSQGVAGAAYNTGGKPLDLSGAKTVHFFARGEQGGEKASFKAFGKDVAPNSGSSNTLFLGKQFALSTPTVTLPSVWKAYTIDVTNVPPTALRGVTQPFAIQVYKGNDAKEQIVYLKGVVIDSAQPNNPLAAKLTANTNTTNTASTSTSNTTSTSPTNRTSTTESFTVQASANATKGTTLHPIEFTGKVVAGGTAPYSYKWNFNDGQTGKGQVVSHLFTKAGTYNVTLTVSDSKGQTASANVIVDISTATSTTTTAEPQSTVVPTTNSSNSTGSSSKGGGK